MDEMAKVIKEEISYVKDSFKNITEEDENNMINRWTKIGFTEGLSGVQLLNVSLAMEAAAIIIIESNKHDEISTILFPIIRRIFQEVSSKIETEVILKNTMDIINEVQDAYPLEGVQDAYPPEGVLSHNVDPEAYFCSVFSTNYKLKL